MAWITLDNIYSDHMIIQRRMPVRISGTLEQACCLTACLGCHTKTESFPAGSFTMTLPQLEAARDLTLTLTDGTNTLRLCDVAVGEIWVAAGQSNMEMRLKDTEGFLRQGETVEENEWIRFFQVGRNSFSTPEEYPAGYDWALNPDLVWAPCTVQNAPFFSAVGYYFARQLQAELGIPVGIINCNVGGTTILGWLSREAISAFPALKADACKQMDAIRQVDPVEDHNQFTAFLDQNKAEWTAPDYRNTHGGEIPSLIYDKPGRYHFQNPTRLFTSMLQKIIAFPVRGMLWYQGESEGMGNMAASYEDALEALLWQQKTLSGNPCYAFHLISIAPWDISGTVYHADDWAGICNAQRSFALHHPDCGLVTTGDCSGFSDIHPPVKQPVGQRLCHAAMTHTYGKEQAYRGPLAASAHWIDGILAVTFAPGDTLMDTDAPIWLEAEWADGTISAVQATVRDHLLIARLPQKPAAVRMGWTSFYQIALKSNNNLPASPFRLPVCDKRESINA